MYTQFKNVVELDDKIGFLHQELAELYAKRAVFAAHPAAAFAPSNTATPQTANPANINTVYAGLAAAWDYYSIVIPKLSELRPKLTNAFQVLQNIIVWDAAVGAQMSIVLVPPTEIIDFPLNPLLRQNQSHVMVSDFINSDLLETALPKKKSWQVLVANHAPTGFKLGSAEDILIQQSYRIAGYDARALGVRQYLALSLQINQPLDKNAWTLLLNDNNLLNQNLVPSATFLNGQFRFELDGLHSVLGEERFRPAIEIKA